MCDPNCELCLAADYDPYEEFEDDPDSYCPLCLHDWDDCYCYDLDLEDDYLRDYLR